MTSRAPTIEFPYSPFRKDCLQGKVALVTGGGSGICFEITRQLLQHGVRGAVICGRRASFLERSALLLNQECAKQQGDKGNQLFCLYKVCDVRDAQQCQEAVQFAVKRFGALDILINGAAGNFLAQAKDLSPRAFANIMAIDAHGTYNMSHAAYPALLKSKQKTAIIINISATLQYGATWWQAHASAAKSAVDSLTRSLALEWGSDNIRVVGIAPGATKDTPGTTKLAPGLDSNDMEDLVLEGIPLGRMGDKLEMAHAAVYLCTAEYVTGHVLVVDGGEWLYRPQLVPNDMVGELSRKIEAKSRAQAPTLLKSRL